MATDGDESRCLSAGMQAYLSKPISFKKMSSTLMKFIKGLFECRCPDFRDSSTIEKETPSLTAGMHTVHIGATCELSIAEEEDDVEDEEEEENEN